MVRRRGQLLNIEKPVDTFAIQSDTNCVPISRSASSGMPTRLYKLTNASDTASVLMDFSGTAQDIVWHNQ